jgi:hypothetical protein
MINQTQDLARLLEWMFAVVSHPDGVRPGVDSAQEIISVDNESIEQVLLPSKNLSVHERLAVYADMYFIRLIESLSEDFPGVLQDLGDESFKSLATRFLVEHPSRNYRLNPLSAGFSEFLAQTLDDPFLSQLAHLELSVTRVFDDKHDEPLSLEQVQAVPVEQWEQTHFTPIRAFRLHQFDYPVNGYLDAVKSEDESIERPARKTSYVLVWRHKFQVLRCDLSNEQYLILTGLDAGQSLGEALEQFIDEPDCNPQDLMANLGRWFQEWSSDGVFSALRAGPV